MYDSCIIEFIKQVEVKSKMQGLPSIKLNFCNYLMNSKSKETLH